MRSPGPAFTAVSPLGKLASEADSTTHRPHRAKPAPPAAPSVCWPLVPPHEPGWSISATPRQPSSRNKSKAGECHGTSAESGTNPVSALDPCAKNCPAASELRGPGLLAPSSYPQVLLVCKGDPAAGSRHQGRWSVAVTAGKAEWFYTLTVLRVFSRAPKARRSAGRSGFETSPRYQPLLHPPHAEEQHRKGRRKRPLLAGSTRGLITGKGGAQVAAAPQEVQHKRFQQEKQAPFPCSLQQTCPGSLAAFDPGQGKAPRLTAPAHAWNGSEQRRPAPSSLSGGTRRNKGPQSLQSLIPFLCYWQFFVFLVWGEFCH